MNRLGDNGNGIRVEHGLAFINAHQSRRTGAACGDIVAPKSAHNTVEQPVGDPEIGRVFGHIRKWKTGRIDIERSRVGAWIFGGDQECIHSDEGRCIEDGLFYKAIEKCVTDDQIEARRKMAERSDLKAPNQLVARIFDIQRVRGIGLACIQLFRAEDAPVKIETVLKKSPLGANFISLVVLRGEVALLPLSERDSAAGSKDVPQSK